MTRSGLNIIRGRSALATMGWMAITMALGWPTAGSGRAQPPDQAKHQHQAAAERKVDETAKVLTPEQRQQLVGAVAPSTPAP